MSTSKQTVDFILQKIGRPGSFDARPMFGEYALYADSKVVALVCDDRLYVKITPASHRLEDICEKGPPYPSAKPHYIVDEVHLTTLPELPDILLAIAAGIPPKPPSKRRK